MASKSFRLLPDGDPKTGMQPSDFTPPEAFTTDDHRETNHYNFKLPDDSILSGVWESAPCREEIDAYPVHEMMTVISGSVTLTHEDGTEETSKAGASSRGTGGPPAQYKMVVVVFLVIWFIEREKTCVCFLAFCAFGLFWFYEKSFRKRTKRKVDYFLSDIENTSEKYSVLRPRTTRSVRKVL